MKKVPAWIRGGSQLEATHRIVDNDGKHRVVNDEGLTFQEWLDAATIVAIRPDVRHEYEAAWARGEDPTEYRNRDRFPQRGIKIIDDLEGSDPRPFYYKVESDDWDEAARKVIETINGVGHFYFGSLQEALDSGPYANAKEFVLKHLHWLKWWYEVYEGSKIDRVFQRRFR